MQIFPTSGITNIFWFFFKWIKTHNSLDAITKAWRLLPLDLCQFGDGVRAVALGEDGRQLLADHLVLTKTEQEKGVRVPLQEDSNPLQPLITDSPTAQQSQSLSLTSPCKRATKHKNSAVWVTEVMTPCYNSVITALRSPLADAPVPLKRGANKISISIGLLHLRGKWASLPGCSRANLPCVTPPPHLPLSPPQYCVIQPV